MSNPTVDKVLVAPKAAVVNSNNEKHSVFQILGSSESYIVNSNSWQEA